MNDTSEKILAGAVLGLQHWEDGKYNLDDYLSYHLPTPDLRRSISSLLFEYFRHKGIIDKLLASFIHTKCKPPLRRILAIAATQLIHQDTLHQASAVNIAVDFVKKLHGKPAGGFANAILRNIIRCDMEQFNKNLTGEEKSNLPLVVYRHWQKIYPDHLPQLIDLLASPAAVNFRACGDELSPDELQKLAAVPIESPGFHFYRSENPSLLFQSPSLSAGRIYIQDPATSLAPVLAALQPGENAADLCAAPGGKTLMLAEQLKGVGSLTVADRSATRQKITAQNLSLRGHAYPVITASVFELPCPEHSFDMILLDAPCSNTGVYHRRPDVLWSFSAAKVKELTKLQLEMLTAGRKFLKPGGRIVYSTCSIEPDENNRLVSEFIKNNPDFKLLREQQLLPGKDHDGAYAAVLVLI